MRREGSPDESRIDHASALSMIGRLRSSELVRHGVIVFAGVLLANVLNYLYYMLVGRTGGVETYGVVTSLASALLVLSAPAIVLQLIVARLAADLEARGDLAALRKLGDMATWWTGCVAIIFVVAGLIFRVQIAQFFNLTSTMPVVISAIAFSFITVVFAQRGVFQGAHRFGDLSASLSIDGASKVAVGIPLVAALGASGALIGLVASQVLAFGYALFAFGKRFGKQRAPLALDRKLVVRVVSHVGLGQLTFTVLMFYDVPLIKHAFDARSAGLYAAAALVGRAVLAAISFVPTLVMPKATARAAAGLSPLPLLGAAAGIAAAIVGAAVLISAVAPQFVVTLIAGRAFGEAAPLVLPYVAASGALALANVVAAYKMGLHRYDFVVPAIVVALAEIITFAVWHPSLLAAITVLLAGHVAIFCATLFRLNEGLGRSDDD
jgi:O-antigen/teichoic acid export membrane protein